MRNGALTEASTVNCGGNTTENVDGHFIFFSDIRDAKVRSNREKNIVSRLVRTATLDVGGVALPELATMPPEEFAICPPPMETKAPPTEGLLDDILFTVR